MRKLLCDAVNIDQGIFDAGEIAGLSALLEALLSQIVAVNKMEKFGNVSWDGIAGAETIEESESEFMFCGLFWTLGGSYDWKIPVQLWLSRVADSLEYKLQVGREDDLWLAMSESKRWGETYQLGQGESLSAWTWAESVQGELILN